MKQAVILAGGKGTRLKDRLNGLPKPMIDVCGIPLIERQIQLLKKYNFTDILILVSYESQKIIDFCNDNKHWGLKIKCIEDKIPMGTAGATINVMEMLNDEFLIIYGDTMLDIDLDRFYLFHKKDSTTAASLFLHPNDHPHDSDLVEINEDNNVICFHPYPHDKSKFYSNLVNAALYWVNKYCLINWQHKVSYLDFGKDIFPKMLEMNYKIRGYRSNEYIKDCGTPTRLDKVCSDLINGKIERSKLNYKSGAVFLDRDGTINKEVNHLSDINDFDLIEKSSCAIRNFNLNELITCVVTNQPVISRGDCSLETLRSIHKKLETLIGLDGAYIDRIYFCPHHPDTGFINEVKELKIICDCRKPKIGMIMKAVSDFNIDLNKSWFIGDSTTDILTAYNAGIKSILVKTGFAGLDDKHLIYPDFIFPDLFSASKFITNDYNVIYDYFEKKLNKIGKGSVIKIGGFSKTGKSTFAMVLKHYLRDKGFNTHLISLDRWIKSKNQRNDTVLGRYNVASINNIFKSVLVSDRHKLKLNLPFYSKKNNKNFEDTDYINIFPEDILIFEGTIVFEVGRRQETIDFFLSIDEENRKERVINEYISRGFSYEDSIAIYNKRCNDEVPIIMNKTFINANALEINLNDILLKK